MDIIWLFTPRFPVVLSPQLEAEAIRTIITSVAFAHWAPDSTVFSQSTCFEWMIR